MKTLLAVTSGVATILAPAVVGWNGAWFFLLCLTIFLSFRAITK